MALHNMTRTVIKEAFLNVEGEQVPIQLTAVKDAMATNFCIEIDGEAWAAAVDIMRGIAIFNVLADHMAENLQGAATKGGIL